jgi:hypothetical protein
MLPVLHAVTCVQSRFVWLHWNGCETRWVDTCCTWRDKRPVASHSLALGHWPTHARPSTCDIADSALYCLARMLLLDCRGQQLGGSSSEDDEWDDPDSPHGQQRRHSTLHVPGQTGGGSGQQGRVSGTGRPLSATRSSSIGAGSRPSSGGVAPRAGGGSSAGGTPWK